jgi:hypothetical protein
VKHALAEDNDASTDALPHKRYRSEPHHSVLLSNEATTATIASPSNYISDFLKSKSALSVIPEEERGSIFIHKYHTTFCLILNAYIKTPSISSIKRATIFIF